MSTLATLASHLPEGFEFYHLGKVARIHSSAQPAPDSAGTVSKGGFAYEILGEDERTWLVLLRDEGADPSTCSEMGNVLASRLADRISAASGDVPIGISPPRALRPMQVMRLLNGRIDVERTTYLHEAPEGWVELEVLLFKSPWEGAQDV